jgi:hypothetical protein
MIHYLIDTIFTLAVSCRQASNSQEVYVAVVSVISVSVQDEAGDEKSTPFYILGTTSLADIQTGVNTLLPLMDAVIDGVILRAQVTIGLTLPMGLKSAPTPDGQDVHNGALNAYSAAATAYRWSNYVPSWMRGGFTGDVVDNTGDFNTYIDEVAALYTDKDGNALDAFLEGKKVRRK